MSLIGLEVLIVFGRPTIFPPLILFDLLSIKYSFNELYLISHDYHFYIKMIDAV